jgi:hypothetical protein
LKHPVRDVGLTVIGIVILAAFFLLFPFFTSTLIVNVHSEHIVNTVHYRLYINGAQQAEGDLAAGDTMIWTLYHRFSLLDSSTITVSVMATGGALGDTQDAKQLTIADGSTYEITLNV